MAQASCTYVQVSEKVTMLIIGTPKTINFPFVENGKLMVLSVPIFKKNGTSYLFTYLSKNVDLTFEVAFYFFIYFLFIIFCCIEKLVKDAISKTELCINSTDQLRSEYSQSDIYTENTMLMCFHIKSRSEIPQKLTQLSHRSHPRHLVGKRTAQKDAIKDITSDSQVNSCFPYRWPPASRTLNIYFYLFLYLYITA